MPVPGRDKNGNLETQPMTNRFTTNEALLQALSLQVAKLGMALRQTEKELHLRNGIIGRMKKTLY